MKKVNPVVYENFDKVMTPSSILELMDEEGVDFAVFLAEIAPLTTGVVKSEFIAEFYNKSERLIPFASINQVADLNLQKTLARLVKDLGKRGLKLLPPYQHFYPKSSL